MFYCQKAHILTKKLKCSNVQEILVWIWLTLSVSKSEGIGKITCVNEIHFSKSIESDSIDQTKSNYKVLINFLQHIIFSYATLQLKNLERFKFPGFFFKSKSAFGFRPWSHGHDLAAWPWPSHIFLRSSLRIEYNLKYSIFLWNIPIKISFLSI